MGRRPREGVIRRVSQPSGGENGRAAPSPAPARGAADRLRSRRRRYNPGIVSSSSALPDDDWTPPASTDD